MVRNLKLAILVLVATSCTYRSKASSRQETVPPAKPPMIVHNPDGTFTVQKEPTKKQEEAAKSRNGLVIPPQIVVPFTLAPNSATHSMAAHHTRHATGRKPSVKVEPTKPAEHQANRN